jgi:hypothetical protein
MLNETNRSYSQELTQLFPAVHIRATQRRYDADAHERAIHAKESNSSMPCLTRRSSL